MLLYKLVIFSPPAAEQAYHEMADIDEKVAALTSAAHGEVQPQILQYKVQELASILTTHLFQLACSPHMTREGHRVCSASH